MAQHLHVCQYQKNLFKLQFLMTIVSAVSHSIFCDRLQTKRFSSGRARKWVCTKEAASAVGRGGGGGGGGSGMNTR